MEATAVGMPLIAWSRAQLDELTAKLAPAIDAWRSEWLPCDGERTICMAAHERAELASAEWAPLGGEQDACGWMLTGKHTLQDWARALFGTAAIDGAPIAQAVCRRAQAAMRQAFAGATALDPSQAPVPSTAKLFNPWSGGVIVESTGNPSIVLLLNAASVRRLVTRRPAASVSAPVAPMSHALADRAVTLRVELMPVELTLGAIAGLRAGDVVSLPHPLEKPLHLSVDGRMVCAGWLGRRHGQRAVELARATPSLLLEPKAA